MLYLYFVAIFSPISLIFLSRKPPTRMSDLIGPKRLKFKQEMSLYFKPQIKLLFEVTTEEFQNRCSEVRVLQASLRAESSMDKERVMEQLFQKHLKI